jgi:hypothetical protein
VRGVEFPDYDFEGFGGIRRWRLPLADLGRDVAILMSSGRDWTDRTKHIAARAPDLDIFSLKRDDFDMPVTAAQPAPRVATNTRRSRRRRSGREAPRSAVA